MIEYSYQIDPRSADLGGDWRLCLLESGDEVGGGVFPLSEYASAENAEANIFDTATPDGYAAY